MSLPITTIVRNSDGSFTYSWASTGALYYRIVLAGIQLDQVSGTSWSSAGANYKDSYEGFPPPIEVMPTTSLALSEQYPSVFVMQWYGSQSVSWYAVQEFVGSVWTTVSRVTESGQWIYTYHTPVLSDETTFQFRVVAVDSLGNESDPRVYTFVVVRPPDQPDPDIVITYTGSGTHQVQIAAS